MNFNYNVKWINNKSIDFVSISTKINECLKTNILTNNGVNVIQLQKTIKQIFKIDENKEILMVCNGAMGINALINGINMSVNKELRWAVQSFTFPCSCQGSLINSLILDIDENMGPSIKELKSKVDLYDGILITNCFGCSSNIELYEEFCKNNNKILLFDNAAASMTFYKGKNHLNYGIGSMVSLHHTKPIGFGEGGFIIFDKKLLECMKKTICFGFNETNKLQYNKFASNFKMSEIAAIYIDDNLKNIDKIYCHYTKLIKYFNKKLNEKQLSAVHILNNYSKYENSLMACVPLVFNKETNINFFIENNIEAKKYYYPLDNNCLVSVDLFKRIICLPLNLDCDIEIMDYYIQIIQNYLEYTNTFETMDFYIQDIENSNYLHI